jgi:hypothetical protein
VPKKLLTIVLAALGGLVLRRQLATRRTEQDLWTEATDPVDLR